jgi:predicted RNase H-like HicB family nuclease
MGAQRYVYWQDGEAWLGYLEEFPDYVTQGDS